MKTFADEPEVTQLQLWGGHECTVNRVGDIFADQTRRSGHHGRDDLEAFAALGITALRYPVLWERTAPDDPAVRDFAWADDRLATLRRLAVRPIVGLVHHGGGPAYTNLLDDGFATGLAGHARAVAGRYPWIADWTPVNEPLTTARFACLYGHWYPHHADEWSFWTALLNQIDATRLAMRAVRQVNPAARLVQTEDLGGATGTPETAAQVEFENHRRWLTWDLLAGRVTPDHALWPRFERCGLGDRLRAIADDPCPADVIGINHYLCSSRYLTHEFDRHPGILPAGDGFHCINSEAVRTTAQGVGIDTLLRDAAARYGTTLAVTECHNGSTRDEQLRWFYQTWHAAKAARADGIDVAAVTAWSLLGAHDWSSLLTRDDGAYEVGVFDARSDPPRPTAMAALVSALAVGTPPPLPHIVTGAGWWQRDIRFLDGYRTFGPALETPAGPPILITGATGTLAQAIAGACTLRGLAHVLTERATLALDNPASIDAALDRFAPWAVINCAGIVDLDAAEAEPARCMAINGNGPVVLAAACARAGIPLVHMSSDQVFAGDGGAPYGESDRTGAVNAYGRAKAAAERGVRAACPRALVIRTAAFFSPYDRHNFAVHVADRLAAGGIVHAAADQFVSPTYVPDLVENLLDLLIDGETGLWHLASDGGVSWAGFAAMLAHAGGYDDRRIIAVPTSALAQRAVRAADARLTSERGQVMRSLDSAVARFATLYQPQSWASIAAE